jgi:hypothetical protein
MDLQINMKQSEHIDDRQINMFTVIAGQDIFLKKLGDFETQNNFLGFPDLGSRRKGER